MPSKKPPMTHSGVIVTKDGRKRMKLRMTATTWCSSAGKGYYKTDGTRCGTPSSKNRLLLDTIKPLEANDA
ncbi:hypothetical protein [Buttiauxella sp. S19-1]|uniref:hypothetical protein n=1 Tax=Buttiauxella sp. S19-1 TaxID=941430 RepID=UPI001EDC018E|nr:hypothetical protein [Buttiauxella sp. S19-1]